MATATTDSSPGAWLARQASGRLRTTLAVFAAAEALLVLLQAGFIAALCHRVIVDGQAPGVELTGALLATLLIRAAVIAGRGWVAADASARIRVDLRRRVLDALRRAGPVGAPPTGRVMAAFDDQVEKLDPFYARFLPQQFGAAVIPLAILVAVFVVDWIAGVFLLFSAPLIPVFMVLIGWGAETRARQQVDALGRLGGWFMDRLRGAATLRRFGAEVETALAVEQRTDELRRASMSVLRLAFLSSAVLEFFASVAIAAVAIYIGMGLLGFLTFGPAGDLTLASGLFVLLLAPEYFAPLRALSQGWHDRADARAAVDELDRLLRLPARNVADSEKTASSAGSRRCAASACSVRIRGLRFAHAGRSVLFDGLDFDLAAGERAMLVGPSGGGKSTLIDLLAGFLSPTAGRIELDGTSVRHWADTERAAHVAWLGQRPTLFAGSLYDNIALGWREADRTDVEAIAETAGVMSFARTLPGGLDVAVGEGGHRLSGGQLQRVALARALLRPRGLILLDEPTAHLDPEGEADVLDALERLLAVRPATVLVASHRAGVLRHADRVFRVDDGRLNEEPTG